jgi:hypothetical protein
LKSFSSNLSINNQSSFLESNNLFCSTNQSINQSTSQQVDQTISYIFGSAWMHALADLWARNHVVWYTYGIVGCAVLCM